MTPLIIVVVLVVGLVLLFTEVAVVPGFGVAGVLAIAVGLVATLSAGASREPLFAGLPPGFGGHRRHGLHPLGEDRAAVGGPA